MKSIIVEIAPSGEVKIEATGFKGKACETATAEMERALGVSGSRKKKPEYFASEVSQQSVGGGR